MKLTLGEMIALVGLVVTGAAAVANIVVVGNKRIRNVIFIGLGMCLSFVLGLIAWPLIWQRDELARTDPPPIPSPTVKVRPTPSLKPTPKPTPEPTPAPEVEEPDPVEAGALHASSLEDPSARARYCVVGDFTAESRHKGKKFEVLLTEANISLCNYSAHGPRAVKIKVGYRGARAGEFFWSRSVTLSQNLNPGETMTLSEPIRLSLPKRGSARPSSDNFIVQLINAPCNTKREMRYYISSKEGVMMAQLKQPRKTLRGV